MDIQLKDLVQINSMFHTSTNIEMNISELNALDSFIPTSSSLDIISWLVKPFIDNNSLLRSHLLTGAYGKGKSYSVLVFLSLLSKQLDKQSSNVIRRKIRTKAPRLEANLNLIKDKKYLPIIIDGGYPSLTTSLNMGLKKAIKQNKININNINSSYTKALDVIASWEKNYPNTYNEFKKLVNITDFIEGLTSFNKSVLDEFCLLYPILTSGSTFEPFSDLEIIKNLSKFSKEIEKYGYNGIVIVYDEFSKYLETYNNNISQSDFRVLQDLAELANNSKENNQIHLLLITHKMPKNYFTSSLMLQEWDAISGRFDYKELINEDYQAYEVIDNVIQKNDNEISEIKKQYNNDYQELKQYFVNKQIVNVQTFETIENCFPLHPFTAYCLPVISSLVAQNTRTLFTFLLAKEPFSLSTLIAKKNDIITVDCLFDYFESSFKKQPFDSLIYKVWEETIKLTRKFKAKENIVKFLKALAIINILNQLDEFPPVIDTLFVAFKLSNFDNKDILQTIGFLTETHDIITSVNNMYISIFHDTHNILEALQIEERKIQKNIDVAYELNTLIHKAFYPIAYNDEFNITRYFELCFCNGNEDKIKAIDFTNNNPDGKIYAIIPNNLDSSAIKTLYYELNNSSMNLFVLPNNLNLEDLFQTLVNYKAICNLYKKYSEDEIDEMALLKIELIKADNFEKLLDVISFALKPYSKKTEIVSKEKTSLKCKTKKDFTDLLSTICKNTFTSYPIINKEDINVQKLSGTALSARNNIIDVILNKSTKQINSFKETSQEASFIRTIILNNNLAIDEGNELIITLPSNKESNFFEVFEAIRDFTNCASSNVSFKVLYQRLQNSNFKIGLKRGVIPVFIALALSQFKDQAVIYNSGKNELQLCAQSLSNVDDNPEDFYLTIQNWDTDKAEYLKTLNTAFSTELFPENSLFSLVGNFVNWYNGLPIVTKNTLSKLQSLYPIEFEEDKLIQKFTQLISKYEGNPWNFFFNKIPTLFKLEPSLKLAEEIISIKKYLTGLRVDNANKLKSEMLKKASIEDTGAFSKNLINFYNSQLNIESKFFTKNVSLVNNLFCQTIVTDERLFEQLTHQLVGIRFSDWGSDSFDVFANNWEQYLIEISDDSDSSTDENFLHKLKIIDEIQKSISDDITSGIPEMAQSEIVNCLEEYSDSLTLNQKRSILLKIILEL